MAGPSLASADRLGQLAARATVAVGVPWRAGGSFVVPTAGSGPSSAPSARPRSARPRGPLQAVSVDAIPADPSGPLRDGPGDLGYADPAVDPDGVDAAASLVCEDNCRSEARDDEPWLPGTDGLAATTADSNAGNGRDGVPAKSPAVAQAAAGTRGAQPVPALVQSALSQDAVLPRGSWAWHIGQFADDLLGESAAPRWRDRGPPVDPSRTGNAGPSEVPGRLGNGDSPAPSFFGPSGFDLLHLALLGLLFAGLSLAWRQRS